MATQLSTTVHTGRQEAKGSGGLDPRQVAQPGPASAQSTTQQRGTSQHCPGQPSKPSISPAQPSPAAGSEAWPSPRGGRRPPSPPSLEGQEGTLLTRLPAFHSLVMQVPAGMQMQPSRSGLVKGFTQQLLIGSSFCSRPVLSPAAAPAHSLTTARVGQRPAGPPGQDALLQLGNHLAACPGRWEHTARRAGGAV